MWLGSPADSWKPDVPAESVKMDDGAEPDPIQLVISSLPKPPPGSLSSAHQDGGDTGSEGETDHDEGEDEAGGGEGDEMEEGDDEAAAAGGEEEEKTDKPADKPSSPLPTPSYTSSLRTLAECARFKRDCPSICFLPPPLILQ